MRIAANLAVSGLLVPWRQVTRRQGRSASTASAGCGSSLGTSVRARPEGGTRAIARIGQHDAEPHACGKHAVQLGQSDLAFARRHHHLLRDARPGAAFDITRPFLRQEEPQADRHWQFALRQGQRHQGVAVRPLAKLSAILPCHSNRQGAFLRQGGVVDHEIRLLPADQPVRLPCQHRPQRTVIPGRACNEVLQLVMP
jgi:hypothetical protein